MKVVPEFEPASHIKGISEVLDQQSYENKTRLTRCGSKGGGGETPFKKFKLVKFTE